MNSISRSRKSTEYTKYPKDGKPSSTSTNRTEKLHVSGRQPADDSKFGGAGRINLRGSRVRPVKFDRLYELRDLGGQEDYFSDIDERLDDPLSRKKLAESAESLNRLDEESWNYLKGQCKPLLSKVSEDRGWTPLFERLNEAKGYGYLLDRGCSSPKFITRSDKNGHQTPDLEASDGTSEYLCEVKTINRSDKEIKRRKNREAKEVAYVLSDELKSKLEDVAGKAISQLRGYQGAENKIKIAFFVICLDDRQPESRKAIFPEIQRFLDKFGEGEIDFVLHGLDY